MLLAIDIGNTNVVVGLMEDGTIRHSWRVSTHPLITSDEFRAKLQSVFWADGIDWNLWKTAAVSSVVPAMTAVVREAFPGRHVVVIDHRSPFSFSIRATPPEQIGADRLVNAEAAIREYGAPVLIVDSGTATTICAVSRDRAYLGGAIMPGIELSSRALVSNTAKLFSVELTPPDRAIGTNTQEALRSGLLIGYASMVDGMIRRFKAELGEPDIKVVATGGVSGVLRGILEEKLHFDPDLTLKGIWSVHHGLCEL